MIQQYKQWLENVTESDLKSELLGIQGNDAEIGDRFYRALEFGTGGLRGIIGAGTNRMNVYTVGRATFGLAEYILESGVEKKVAIAYDSRRKSREFAFHAADILSSKGIEVFIFNELMPTPVLSYAVRELKAGAGIVITASHNPKEYNGYKVYNEFGCQITDVAAKAILKKIESAQYFAQFTPLAEKIHILGNELLDSFLSKISEFSLTNCVKESGLEVVYTPLHGTGNVPVRKILDQMGASVIIVKEQELPDGEFTTCPYPNPEEKEALSLALEYAKAGGADLVLATDPDADRVGIAVRDAKGEYTLLNGNETGVLMMAYMLSQKREQGKLGADPTIIKTIVTTDMAFGLAQAYNAAVKEVLTGFKYIGEELDKTENYVMGLEESYGYLVGDHARDKDAVSAAMMIVEMCAYYKTQGITLLEQLQKLYKEFGYYKTELKSIKYEGQKGMETMAEIINRIRENPIAEFEGKALEFTDYATGVNGLPRSNVLRFRNEDVRLIIRPSGTEPKLKIYYQAKGATEAEADKRLQALVEFSGVML